MKKHSTSNQDARLDKVHWRKASDSLMIRGCEISQMVTNDSDLTCLGSKVLKRVWLAEGGNMVFIRSNILNPQQ